jgi:hypothetical protein
MPVYNGTSNPYWVYRPETATPTYPYQYPQPTTGGIGYSQLFSQRPQNNLLKVTGPESAKAYPIPPNSEVALFDAENPVFYVKTTDASGYPTLRTFRFEEQTPKILEMQPAAEATLPDLSGYASKEDLGSLKADISEIKETLKGLM